MLLWVLLWVLRDALESLFGRFGEVLWVLWHALGTLFGTLWHKEGKKARNGTSPGRMVFRLGFILKCFLAYFAKNRRLFK